MTDNQSSVAPTAPSVWMRGLWMIVVMCLFGIAQSLLGAATVVQFFWMLFGGKPSEPLAEFGTGLSHWMAKAARYLTAASEEKPFPWTPWNQTTPPAA